MSPSVVLGFHVLLLCAAKGDSASRTEGYLNGHRAIAGRRAYGLPEGSKGQQKCAGELAKVVPQRSAVCRCCSRPLRRRITCMRV